MNRYARQERIIGTAAQSRIGAATVRVQSTSNAEASVEARYLAGAGVAGLRGSDRPSLDEARALNSGVAVQVDQPPEPRPGAEAPSWTADLSPSAAAFARGALLALQTLRASSRRLPDRNGHGAPERRQPGSAGDLANERVELGGGHAPKPEGAGLPLDGQVGARAARGHHRGEHVVEGHADDGEEQAHEE